MGPQKRKASDRDEADEAHEAETADAAFLHLTEDEMKTVF